MIFQLFFTEQENLSGLPPAYLSVANFDSCLKEHQASANHVEWCIPQIKPNRCDNESWTQLKNVFRGITCPPIKIAFSNYSPPPSWLNIPGTKNNVMNNFMNFLNLLCFYTICKVIEVVLKLLRTLPMEK